MKDKSKNEKSDEKEKNEKKADAAQILKSDPLFLHIGELNIKTNDKLKEVMIDLHL